MKFGSLLASVGAGALAVSPAVAAAETPRGSEPAEQESRLGESAPWPLIAVGIAAAAALVFLLVDDDEDDPVSA